MSRPSTQPESLIGQPFRGVDAIAAGLLTRRQLQSPIWRRLFNGIYVHRDVTDSHLLRCQAMALHLPDCAVITGRSAAEVWGVRLASAADPVEVLNPRRMRQVDGSSVRNGKLDASEKAVHDGVGVPTPLHTAWEIARTLPTVEAVPWIDALARVRGINTAALVNHATRHQGEHGCEQASETLELCDRRAESGPESIVRVSLVLAGLPAPVPQFRVVVDRQFIARVDLAWPELRLAVEYDGQWHADRDQLTRDRRRIRALNAAGWYVYPVTRHDLRDLPGLVATIEALIATRSTAL